MRAVLQRVRRASVTVADEMVGSIGPGLCVFVGVAPDDNVGTARHLSRKLWTLRVFDDAAGRMNRSLEDVGGSVLVVSQFTLLADASRGRRPSYTQAARPELAEPLVEEVADGLRSLGAAVATGRFGASMVVEIVNDGPVTLVLDV